MTEERWLELHRYLEPIARLQRLVDEAAAAIPAAALAAPRWESYAADLADGVPLLASAAHGLDAVPPAADALRALCERLAEAPLPGTLAGPVHALRDALRRSPGEARRVVEWTLAGAEPGGAPEGAGVASFLAWTALRTALAPVLADFGRWRGDRWTRSACPTCGAQPAMAQLVADGELRQRHLACGRCATRWRYRRVACPHCQNEAADRLGALELDEDGAALRLDYCDDCKGYVKTYAAEGDEALLLADWSTLHLDALAAGRGLRRAGASLYAL
jgi:FdhE protein